MLRQAYEVIGEMGNIKVETDNCINARNYRIIREGIIIGEFDKGWSLGEDKYNLEIIDEEYKTISIILVVLVNILRCRHELF